jgi:ketosteroid isomerase-like protein
MDAIQSGDILQIQNLVADYGWYADARDVSGYAGLFIEQAVFCSPNTQLSLSGREAIIATIDPYWKKADETGEQRRHIISGVKVTEYDGESARYRAILNLSGVMPGDTPRLLLSGVYLGEVVKTEQGWRFARVEFLQDGV